MGKIINNPITTTFSGSLGEDLVFRRVGNSTFFTKRPVRTKKSATLAQQNNRHSFAEAQYYARISMLNPDLSELYCIMAKVNNLKNAHRAAANDFMTKPEIASVVTTGYQGNVGDVILIKPKIYLKITHIIVTIYDAQGAILESGPGIKNELNFKYCATVTNASVEGSKIIVVTHDRLRKSCRIGALV